MGGELAANWFLSHATARHNLLQTQNITDGLTHTHNIPFHKTNTEAAKSRVKILLM